MFLYKVSGISEDSWWVSAKHAAHSSLHVAAYTITYEQLPIETSDPIAVKFLPCLDRLISSRSKSSK